MNTSSSVPPSSEPTPSRPRPRSLIAYCLERDTLLFSLKMALLIGTLLAASNEQLRRRSANSSSNGRLLSAHRRSNCT